ncbi:DnaB-like helicase C-terminal domain-containing protein [Cronobacter sakazakii]|uniref:DnaB-like helicase C-terminal domain-containing protein n=1 Tax=Cronobacter sakazakii TaxID=28141 RepID=UPI000BE8B991|nr:DnaB-like helicase C-terminal domain-containing protein [Cronobacter sakazakii]ELY2770994.1 AAA family ATPase [Cronobacter sakazakii]ELY3417135.1 AAA family ATPase [Cronobacter sakazakii]MBF4821273.1 AAA family ATPase [Cronobacter sakazakii]MBF4825155.1 AAA family ATPase [Cronobacter sakazakii]PUV58025.1 helicase DnaB [Cronobacter sakazakii]
MTDDIKTPPCNYEAEQAVLGSVMVAPDSDNVQKVLGFLNADMFYSRQHGRIFAALQGLNAKGKALDMLTLSDALEMQGELEQVGGFAYLADISRNTPSAANVMHYANVVKDKSTERMAIEQATQMLEVLYSRSGMTTAQKLEAVQALAMKVDDKAKTGNHRGLMTFRDAFNKWTYQVGERLEGNPSSVGLTSGIEALDEMLEPKRIVRGSLFVVGARPKMGKTTVYQKMAIHCALVENLPTLAFSLEMPTEQLVERIISQHSRVKSDVFYQNGYNENQFAQALAMGTQIADSNNLYIDDTPGLSLAHIVSESRRIKRERGEVGMVLVDYLTLMAAEKADTESQAYGIITKGLKILAKELNCVVVLLTQLNRGSEARANKRPQPSDSRSTGQIEQDCDYWLGIYRESEDDDTVNPAETELLLRLNRHGNTGTVYVEQRNGILYDIDQQEARFRREERERKPNKKGGF